MLVSPDSWGSGKWIDHDAFQEGSVHPTEWRSLAPWKTGAIRDLFPFADSFCGVEETPQAVYVKTWDSPSEATLGLAVSEEAWDKILYLSTVAWSYLSSKQALRRSVRHSKGESLLCPD